MTEHILSQRAGKLVIDKIGDNITLRLWYETEDIFAQPHQSIPLYPEELDNLCEWWKKNK